MDEVGLRGACADPGSPPCPKPESRAAPDRPELIPAGQAMQSLLLPHGQHSARQPGTSLGVPVTPGLDGKLADGSLQGVEGKID